MKRVLLLQPSEFPEEEEELHAPSEFTAMLAHRLPLVRDIHSFQTYTARMHVCVCVRPIDSASRLGFSFLGHS